ncbi:MAG TPA: proline racemase family protein [Trueperaceae bacterium]|nr:proline racemase family protein [Trueperaceae bacterium]
MKRLQFVDSHTGGEPTRLVVAGGPELGGGPLAGRLERFKADHDRFRRAVVNEPRGSDVLVGGLLCPPTDANAAAGVIFFNNVGYLGMCGHGTIGLVATLAHLGQLGSGRHLIETPVGDVTAELHADGRVSVHNVPAYRHAAGVSLQVEWRGELRTVTGDVAWGGNWFFLCTSRVDALGLSVNTDHLEELTEFSWALKQALVAAGITGAGGAEIDHVELFVPGVSGADSRSFVLCPGKAYDRSPCGTGTSAKLACLAADGLLAPGAPWVQESVIGSRFEARYSLGSGGAVLPVITGRAHVMAEGALLIDPADEFGWGIP